MKKLKEWFKCYDFGLAFGTAAILTAVITFFVGIVLAAVNNDATWLWIWAISIVLGSAVAGTM